MGVAIANELGLGAHVGRASGRCAMPVLVGRLSYTCFDEGSTLMAHRYGKLGRSVILGLI